MLKMLSTQLAGVFNKMMNNEEFHIEDGARLLAQAPVGEGNIYIKGFKEMKGVTFEALEGAEPWTHVKQLTDEYELLHTDRVILFTRFSNDEQALALGKRLTQQEIPFISVAGTVIDDKQCLSNIADIHINTHLIRPLLPTEDGSRIGFPSPISALFIYYALKFTTDDILAEHE